MDGDRFFWLLNVDLQIQGYIQYISQEVVGGDYETDSLEKPEQTSHPGTYEDTIPDYVPRRLLVQES